MAGENKNPKEGGSAIVVAVLGLFAAGAAVGVYYFYDAARKSEELLVRAKEDYRRMSQWKRPVEEYLLQRKGRPLIQVKDTEDLMTFLDKKARESQIPPEIFNPSKNSDSNLSAWKETSYTVTLQSPSKDSPVRRIPVVDFLRKVETERRSTKVKSLQLYYTGDDFRSATIVFSQFQPK